MKSYDDGYSPEIQEQLESISVTPRENSGIFASAHQNTDINIQVQLSANQFETLLQSGYSGQLQNVYYILRENNQVQLSAHSIDDIHHLLSQVTSS